MPSLSLVEAQVVRVGADMTQAIFFHVADHQAGLQKLRASVVAPSVWPLRAALCQGVLVMGKQCRRGTCSGLSLGLCLSLIYGAVISKVSQLYRITMIWQNLTSIPKEAFPCSVLLTYSHLSYS